VLRSNRSLYLLIKILRTPLFPVNAPCSALKLILSLETLSLAGVTIPAARPGTTTTAVLGLEVPIIACLSSALGNIAQRPSVDGGVSCLVCHQSSVEGYGRVNLGMGSCSPWSWLDLQAEDLVYRCQTCCFRHGPLDMQKTAAVSSSRVLIVPNLDSPGKLLMGIYLAHPPSMISSRVVSPRNSLTSRPLCLLLHTPPNRLKNRCGRMLDSWPILSLLSVIPRNLAHCHARRVQRSEL
jgi:hypothetical protein